MQGINLYHCEDEGRGFFVEVSIDAGQGQAVVVRSFVSSGPLEEYAHGVRHPEQVSHPSGCGWEVEWGLD